MDLEPIDAYSLLEKMAEEGTTDGSRWDELVSRCCQDSYWAYKLRVTFGHLLSDEQKRMAEKVVCNSGSLSYDLLLTCGQSLPKGIVHMAVRACANSSAFLAAKARASFGWLSYDMKRILEASAVKSPTSAMMLLTDVKDLPEDMRLAAELKMIEDQNYRRILMYSSVHSPSDKAKRVLDWISAGLGYREAVDLVVKG